MSQDTEQARSGAALLVPREGPQAEARPSLPAARGSGSGLVSARPSLGSVLASVTVRSEDRQSSFIVGPLRNRASFAYAAGSSASQPVQPAPDMLSTRHLGVYLSYLCVGFIYGSATAIVYPIIVILHGEPNNFQQAVTGSFTLFWSFKVFFGFLSDNVPIFGCRRKPYLLIGWTIAVGSSVALAATAQISGKAQICQDGARVKVSCDGPYAFGPFLVDDLPVSSLIAWMMVNNFGYVLADVAMDSLVIEYAQRESFEDRGAIQGWCYTTRAAGFVVSYGITGFGLNGPEYGGSFSSALPLSSFLWILVGLQSIGLPWWIALKDERVDREALGGMEASLRKAWKLLQNGTFSRLMLFNVVMNMSQQVTVNARNTVLNVWVNMSPLVNAMDGMLQQFIMMLTLAAAAKWLKKYSWRGLLVFGSIFFIAVMFLFWLVVFDVARNPWLVVFIDGDQQFAQNIGYLVVMWAVVEMAPAGIEGTALALTTTVANAGQSLGGYVIIAYNGIFSLSRQDLERDSTYTRYQYMYNSLLVMATQCLYMLFLAWMPSQKEDARQKFGSSRHSKAWAVAALFCVFISLTWGLATTIAALFCPCSQILGGSGCANGCTSG